MANSPIITSLTDYVVANRMPVISVATLGSKSARVMEHMAGVKGSEAINVISSEVAFGNGDACGWNEAGASTLSQRVLHTGAVKINMAFCDKVLRKKWAGQELEIKAGLEKLPFAEKFYASIVDGVQSALETAIWQGDTTSSTNNLKYFDGLLKIIAADVTNTETIAAGSTYIKAVQQTLLAIPTKALKEDTVIFCAPEFLRNYEQALVSANLYHFEPGKDVDDITIPGSNVKLVAVEGLAGQKHLVAGRLSNFVYGFDIEDASEYLNAWYSQDNQEFRVNMWFNAGVQIAFPDEIVYATYTTLA